MTMEEKMGYWRNVAQGIDEGSSIINRTALGVLYLACYEDKIYMGKIAVKLGIPSNLVAYHAHKLEELGYVSLHYEMMKGNRTRPDVVSVVTPQQKAYDFLEELARNLIPADPKNPENTDNQAGKS